MTVDEAGFDAAMDAQRERARAASHVQDGRAARLRRRRRRAFRGYETLSDEGRVVALYKDGDAGRLAVDRASAASSCSTARRSTPSPAARSAIAASSRKGGTCLTLFAVDDTQKIQPDVFGHVGEVKTGELKVGDTRRGARSITTRAAARCATTRRRT